MKRTGVWGLTCALMLGLACAALGDRGPWPEYRNDGAKRASQDVSVPIDPNDVLWEIEIPGGSSPGGLTLGPGETVFVKAVGLTGSNVVHCIDRNTGTSIWATAISPGLSWGYGGVCVGTDKVFTAIYNGAGDPGTKVVALNLADGSLAWENFDGVGPRGTPALGTVPNSQGHLNIYEHDRSGNKLLAIDSETGVTQWVLDTSLSVGNVSFGMVGPLWVKDGKQCMFISGDKGNKTESGVAVQDNGDGTYTVLWEGGPGSKNWIGNGVLSQDGTKIYTSTFWDEGAPSLWAISVEDGHVIWSARDVNSFPRPALGPDGTLYTAGSDGSSGAVAAYEEDASGCGVMKWMVNGMRGEIVAMTVINGYIYASDNDGGIWVIKDHGAYGEIIRKTPDPITSNWWWGGALQVVTDENGVGYAADNSAEGAGTPGAPRKVWAFNPVPYVESGGPKITSITRGSIELAWDPADPAIYTVWRADDVAGPYAPISEVLFTESYTDAAPPAEQAFYKVELHTAIPFDDVAYYDFDDGDQGWTHGGVVDDWELGTPTDYTGTNGAPAGAYSPPNCWATKLTGDYSSSSECWLKSPVFQITTNRTGRVRFKMWMNSEVDIDVLNLGVYRASDDTVVTNLLTDFSADTYEIDCWPGFSFDFIKAGGIDLYLKFEFLSDEDIEGPGVYIDNVEILESGAVLPIPDGQAQDGLVAFNPDGSIKWIYEAPGGDSWWNRAGYALSPDEGTIYALHRGFLDGGGIWAIDTSDGSVKWHLNTADPATPNSPDTSGGGNGDFFSTPVVGADGTIYSVDVNGTITAVRDDGTAGTILWGIHQPEGNSAWNYAEAGIGPAGQVLFVSDSATEANKNLFQFDAPGVGTPNAWPSYQGDAGNKGYATGGNPATNTYITAFAPGGLWCGVALSGNDHWIIPSNDAAKLKAYDTSLTLLWEFTMDDWSDGGPAVAPDGTIYVGDNSGAFFSITEDNSGGPWTATQNWKVDLGGQVNSRPSIGPDGTIYVVAGGGSVTLYALDPADGSEKWSTPVDGGDAWQMATAVSPDGSAVYFRTKGSEGLLYAVSTADGSVLWTRHVGSSWDGLQPVVGTDGTIYQGATNIENPIVP